MIVMIRPRGGEQRSVATRRCCTAIARVGAPGRSAVRSAPTARREDLERLIPAEGPFAWAASLDVVANFGPLRRHAGTGTDPLRLTFLLDGTFAPVGVALREAAGGLLARIVGTADGDTAARQVARIFSLDHDGSDLALLGDRDPAFGRVLLALPGLRPVCFTSPYECAAWAVISQRIATRQAAAIQDRLIEEHGVRLVVDGEPVGAFPQPAALLAVDAFASLPAEKIARLHAVARAALEGLLDVEHLRELGERDAIAALRTIRGIGGFWASGIYLRACGIVDAWPEEPISNAALGVLHGLGDHPSDADVRRLTDAYRPYRMWAAFLLRVAANRGIIPGIAGREMRIRESATRRS